MESFQKSWSYFISSILIHRYYQELYAGRKVKQKINIDKYLQAIENYTRRQLQRGNNDFGIVYLFLLIYKEKQKESPLSFLLYIIQNPQHSLRFVCQQLLSPLEIASTEKELWEKKLKKLEDYKNLMIQVYEERKREEIIP